MMDYRSAVGCLREVSLGRVRMEIEVEASHPQVSRLSDTAEHHSFQSRSLFVVLQWQIATAND